LPVVVADIAFGTISFNRNEEPMGSTASGIARPIATIGPALPTDIEIDRAGLGRVRGDGSA
jgi:hypothetical protein